MTSRKLEIDQKRTSELIDELVTCLIKCYMAQEQGPTRDLEKAQKENARRSLLVRALDKRFDESYASPDEKNYS